MRPALTFPQGRQLQDTTKKWPVVACQVCVAVLTFHLAVQTTHAAGAVVAWGDNESGQTNVPPGVTNVVEVAGGSSHSLALERNGAVIAWGDNTYGEATAPAVSNSVALAAGKEFSLALQSNGAVVAWGRQVSVPASLTNAVAVAAAQSNVLALTEDGNVIELGSGPTPPADATNLVAIAAGDTHSLALRGDGKVIAWGNAAFGLTNVPPGLTDVVELAAGQFHNLALRGNGTVVAWGDNTWGQTNVPAGLTDVVEIAAGAYHNLALQQDGAVAVWGDNSYGQTNLPPGLTNASRIAAGRFHNLAILGDGSPVITVQPVGRYNPATQDAAFQVMVVGRRPLSYQWQLNGTNLVGETNSTLVVANVTPPATGVYSVTVTNALGMTTSAAVPLPPVSRQEPCPAPLITSALTAAGTQGAPFSYAITASHEPVSFNASGLPDGLAVNATNGLIQGTPLQSGTFVVTLGAANSCASSEATLQLSIASSAPVITSAPTAPGTEESPFYYQIAATGSPTGYGAENLPQGLDLDSSTGVISGSPLYAGNFDVTIFATNEWGVGAAGVELVIANERISGLSVFNLTTNYSSPYLLDFQFSLRDNSDPTLGNAVVANPGLFRVTAFEDSNAVSPTETSVLLEPASAKVLKAYLVLDFSDSVASLANGDTNNNGISDAVEAEMSAAQEFVNQQPADAEIGVYEFHRDDEAPQQVQSLTTDKTQLDDAIAGIWTNYVRGFPAGSRCWDALTAAIAGLGSPTNTEAHYVIFVSDGQDTSSTNTYQSVISAATNGNVQVYCVGFGDQINTQTLLAITSQTLGRYYPANSVSGLAAGFAQIGKDLNGQYILRWATLQRSTNAFMPSFQITYQGLTADSPTNPISSSVTNIPVVDTNGVPVTNSDGTPVMTNVTIYTTNYIISPYLPTAYAGPVTVGSLFLEPDADVHPTGFTLRAFYVPRYIRQIRLHFQANYPAALSLDSTNPGEMLDGWSLTQSNDPAGGEWAVLSSSNTQSLATSIPFASFGPLLTFSFRDKVEASNAFSFFGVDNDIYTNGGGHQSFVIENTNAFVTSYPSLPHGTPVPWLIQYGFTNAGDWVADETNDTDGDGQLNWQEYVAGTDPTNAGSVFAVKSVAPTGRFGHYQITFSTALNRTYRVETSSDLLNWQTLQNGIAGTGGDVTVTDTRNLPATTPVFYRVAVSVY